MNPNKRYTANITVDITVDIELEEGESLTQAVIEKAYADSEWDIHDHTLGVVYDRDTKTIIEPESIPEGDDA